MKIILYTIGIVAGLYGLMYVTNDTDKNYIVHSLREGDALIEKMLSIDTVSSCQKIKFGGIDIANETNTIRFQCIEAFAVANNDASLCDSLKHFSTQSVCVGKVEKENKK